MKSRIDEEQIVRTLEIVGSLWKLDRSRDRVISNIRLSTQAMNSTTFVEYLSRRNYLYIRLREEVFGNGTE